MERMFRSVLTKLRSANDVKTQSLDRATCKLSKRGQRKALVHSTPSIVECHVRQSGMECHVR